MWKHWPQGLVLLCLCGFVFSAEPTAIWLDIPFVKQTKDGCGAASVAMVMQYWSSHGSRNLAESVSDPDAIFRNLYSPEAHGIYASRLEGYLQQNGFRTFVISGRWDELKQHLQRGRPLIVAFKPGSGSLHYAVVAGMDERENVVMLNDPAQRKLLKSGRAEFEKNWSGTNNWMLLAVPNASVP
jgi:ABC-type bacteriocin/lantibiotic exporter with double-glycine peptidase domain